MRDMANRQMPDGSSQLPLAHITFYDQHACDLGCFHCSAGPCQTPDGTQRNALPKDLILTAIREALPLGLQTVQFSGGEILNHPEITSLLDELKQLKLGVTIETDGSGMSPERAEQLASIPRCRVMLGIDSVDPATHDRLHAKPGAYDLVVLAARLLKQAGLPAQVIFNVQRQNAGQVTQMIRLAENLGVTTLRLVTPRPVYSVKSKGNGHRPVIIPTESLSVEELIALGWRIERKLSDNTPVHLFFDQPPVFRGLHTSAPIEGPENCDILTSLSVTNSGDYAMCGLAENIPELMFGQVGRDPLEQIWRSHPVLTSLRSGLPERLQGICDRCIMKASCLGNCPAENYLRSGSFFGAYWFCEAADQAGLFPAGRLIENHW